MPRPVLRPDKYMCPECKRFYGEMMNTGHLSNHKAKGGDGFTLCKGSNSPIAGLTVGSGDAAGGRPRPARNVSPGQQELPLWDTA